MIGKIGGNMPSPLQDIPAGMGSFQLIHPSLSIPLAVVCACALALFLYSYFRGKSVRSRPPSPQDRLTHGKYEMLLEASGLGVFECHNFDDSQQLMFWSAQLFELLDLEAQTIQPSVDFYLSLIHPEDRHLVQNSFRRLEARSLAVTNEFRIRVGQQYRWVRTRQMTKWNTQSGPQYLIGTLEDIHEQKAAADRIHRMAATLEGEVQKRTQQLESANKAKTRFLAHMGHELRTPLGLILGFLEVLQEKKNLDTEAKVYLDLISKNGEILSRVINDLLDLSKIEAGKLKFQFSKVRLRTLVLDLENAFREKIEKKNIQFKIQNQCGESEFVVTDEIRLKQAIYNLFSNALKYTEAGVISLVLGKRDSIFCVDIVDTGTGIPESEKEALFDEKARSGKVESAKSEGTGLGLRLAQNLAKALGGDLQLISSQVDRGSHFRLSFSNQEEKLQKQSERKLESTLSSQLSSFEIFVLDDNGDNIRLAEIFLRKLGCRVRGFTSAKSLFAEMMSLTPDLIFLDIHMPEMNGFEVFDHLRKMGYSNPIWALTAYSLNEDIQKMLAHGFDDYIRKPISLDTMKRKLTFELSKGADA